MMTILHISFVSHHYLEKVSANLNDENGVFSGTGMPDMLGLMSKTKTQKSEPTADANSVEPSQKDVSNLMVTVSFALAEETRQPICSNPDLETAFNVMVKRRRADVSLQKQKTWNSTHLSSTLWQSWKLAVCSDENALGCDTQG